MVMIPTIGIIILVTTFLVLAANRPSSWQDELERYLQYKNISGSGEYQIQSTIAATKPWNYNADMSKASFGESAYYQTDFRYGETPPDQNTFDLIPGDAPNGSLMPLPFPPDKVWCVLVENVTEKESSYNGQGKAELVLVALHQDLYNADIVTHETDVEPLEFDIAARIGCEFP
jgi:hypothetical protein